MAARYTGGFDAKKRSVTLPSGVSEPVWGLDKGKLATGAGTIDLSLWDDGRVTGTTTGSLGDLTVEGYASKDGAAEVVAASVSPVHGQGFRGTLAGKIEGGELRGALHVASDDTTLVREASFELRPPAK